MDPILKFYHEWRERRFILKRFSSMVEYFIISWLILLCIIVGMFYENSHIARYPLFYALMIFLALGLWQMLKYREQVRAWKYQNFLERYKALTSEILKDVIIAWDKGYSDVFYDYEMFMGISPGMNEAAILKRLQTRRWTKRYSQEMLEDIARIHASVYLIMEKEGKKRGAESLQRARLGK